MVFLECSQDTCVLVENLSALQSTSLFLDYWFLLIFVWELFGWKSGGMFSVVIFTYPQRDPAISTSQQAEVAETFGGTDGS